MKCFHFRSIGIPMVACGLWLAGALPGAPLQSTQSPANVQSSSKPKPDKQSRIQKVANPLNDLLDEAQRDIDNKNFEAAIAPLQKVIADQPEFAYAHFQLAYVYTALKKADEARAEYEHTIALDPKMGEAYLNLGLLFLQSNPPGSEPAFDRAVPPLRKAVELMPGQKQPLRTLAVAQERSGDVNGAEESFGALLRLDPDDLDANTFVGGQFLRKNMPQEAEARFRHALEHYPGFPPALVGLARSLEEQKKTGEAVDVYRQSLARVPNRDIRVRIVHLLMDDPDPDVTVWDSSKRLAIYIDRFSSLFLLLKAPGKPNKGRGKSGVMFERMAKPRLGFLRHIFSQELSPNESVGVQIVGIEAQKRAE